MALNQWTDYRKGGNTIGIGVRIKHDSPDVANNRTRVYYEAYYYRIGSYNWFENPYTTGTLQIYGQTVYNNNRQLVNLYNQTQHIMYSGDMWIPHLANGTRQIAYNFTHDGSIVPPIDASLVVSGGYQLPDIPRVSKATLSKATFNFGESITVTTNRNDGSFTHNIFYVRNGVETSLATGVGVSGTIAIPNSLMTSHPNTTTANLAIRVKTYTSGSVMIGSHDIPVTVNIPSGITPNITGVTFTGSNAIFTANTQFIRDIDKLKATGSGVVGSNGSTVTTYQYRVTKGTTVMANMSSSANGATFPVFNFPNSGSDVYAVQMKVIDSRGRESAWVSSASIRVHYYRAPVIGSMSVSRIGAANTTFQARRNHTVTSLLESGQAAQQKNTASLQFRYRARGATAWTNNGTVSPVTGANSTALSLVNSDANLVGAFPANTSYEVQAVLSDKLNTVYSSIILVGGQFLPFSLAPKGAGVGKMHSGGPADLEVGAGGVHSEGAMNSPRYNIGNSGALVSNGIYNRMQTDNGYIEFGPANASWAHIYTDRPEFYFNREIRVNNHKVWNANNDGSGSGLDADLLDGKHASSFIDLSNVTEIPNGTDFNNLLTPGIYQKSADALVAAMPNSPDNYSGYLEVFGSPTMTYQRWTSYLNNNVYIRRRYASSWGIGWTNLNSNAFTTGSSGNGDWIRFSSGHTYAWGKQAYGTSSALVPMPRAFSTTPVVTVTATHAVLHPGVNISGVGVDYFNISAVDARNGGLWGTGVSSGAAYAVHWQAMGMS